MDYLQVIYLQIIGLCNDMSSDFFLVIFASQPLNQPPCLFNRCIYTVCDDDRRADNLSLIKHPIILPRKA